MLARYIEQPLAFFRPEIKSKHSIWDVKKLSDRFSQPEYDSSAQMKKLLEEDALHYAMEEGLVKIITQFTYHCSFEDKNIIGGGYQEDLLLLMNNFGQDLANKGLSAGRATIENSVMGKIKNMLIEFAKKGEKKAIIMTSFPDTKENGYHGADSVADWDKPETHHSFFYLTRPENITAKGFDIVTTQYRLWPNARQALQIHAKFGCPINDSFLAENKKENIPNLLLANLIVVDENFLSKIAPKDDFGPKEKKHFSDDYVESEIEALARRILFFDHKNHKIDFTKIPELDQKEFWQIHKEYFNDFYLEVALPIFKKINILKRQKQELELENLIDKQTAKTFVRSIRLIKIEKEIQSEIEKLDDAFSFYRGVLLGYIKNNNKNPLYEQVFLDQSLKTKFGSFTRKIIFKILKAKGLTSDEKNLPTTNKLKNDFYTHLEIKSGNKVSLADKMSLIETWGFINIATVASSLLQCGLVSPFSLSMSILKQPFSVGKIAEFSGVIKTMSFIDKQIFLDEIKNQDYVELDLRSKGAKKIYMVPKNYLEGNGCIVDETGNVLGPCIDPSTGNRIALEDPRDTLAYPLNKEEFESYLNQLETEINEKDIEFLELKSLENNDKLSPYDIEQTKKIVTYLKKILIKNKLGIQEFITGEFVKQTNHNNKWIKDLLTKLRNSSNPIRDMLIETKKKIKEDPNFFEDISRETTLGDNGNKAV